MTDDPDVRAAIIERITDTTPWWVRSLELLDAHSPVARVPIYCGNLQVDQLEIATDTITNLLFAEFYSHFLAVVQIKRKGKEAFVYARPAQAALDSAAMMALVFTMPAIARGPVRSTSGSLDWELRVSRMAKALTRSLRLCQWCGQPFRASKNQLKCSDDCKQQYESAYEEQRRPELIKYKADARSDDSEQRLIDNWLAEVPKAERKERLERFRTARYAEGATRAREFERLFKAVDYTEAFYRLYKFVTSTRRNTTATH